MTRLFTLLVKKTWPIYDESDLDKSAMNPFMYRFKSKVELLFTFF